MFKLRVQRKCTVNFPGIRVTSSERTPAKDKTYANFSLTKPGKKIIKIENMSHKNQRENFLNDLRRAFVISYFKSSLMLVMNKFLMKIILKDNIKFTPEEVLTLLPAGKLSEPSEA